MSTEEEIMSKYFHDRAVKAVSTRWKKYPKKIDRLTQTAHVSYARKLKNEGQLAANAWLINHFGETISEMLLSTDKFKRLIAKYLT